MQQSADWYTTVLRQCQDICCIYFRCSSTYAVETWRCPHSQGLGQSERTLDNYRQREVIQHPHLWPCEQHSPQPIPVLRKLALGLWAHLDRLLADDLLGNTDGRLV